MSAPKASLAGKLGAAFSVALLVLFVALKLAHVIAWSWLWVTAPLWVPVLVVVALLVLAKLGLVSLGDILE